MYASDETQQEQIVRSAVIIGSDDVAYAYADVDLDFYGAPPRTLQYEGITYRHCGVWHDGIAIYRRLPFGDGRTVSESMLGHRAPVRDA